MQQNDAYSQLSTNNPSLKRRPDAQISSDRKPDLNAKRKVEINPGVIALQQNSAPISSDSEPGISAISKAESSLVLIEISRDLKPGGSVNRTVKTSPALTEIYQIYPQISSDPKPGVGAKSTVEMGPVDSEILLEEGRPSNLPTVNVITTPIVPMPNQNKDYNTMILCRIGQETVQEIVSRTQEVFGTLKFIQLTIWPGPGTIIANERKARTRELLRIIGLLFKRLHLIFGKCGDNYSSENRAQVYEELVLPPRNELNLKSNEHTSAESREIFDEYNDLNEQISLLNRQLKEVIDHLRNITWEINKMLSMRRT